MPEIGKDCDVTLHHPLVNDGQPVGLLLFRDRSEPTREHGPAVQIHYEAYTDPLGQTGDVRHLWFTVFFGANVLGPAGCAPELPARVARQYLIDIVTRHSDITLTTPVGILAGLTAAGNVLIEKIWSDTQAVTVHLSTRGAQFAPVDPGRYGSSAWVDGAAYSGPLTWDNSYWKT
jgi:hypothetical protein